MTNQQAAAIQKIKNAATALRRAIKAAKAEGVTSHIEYIKPTDPPPRHLPYQNYVAAPLSFRFFLHTPSPQPEQHPSPQRPESDQKP